MVDMNNHYDYSVHDNIHRPVTPVDPIEKPSDEDQEKFAKLAEQEVKEPLNQTVNKDTPITLEALQQEFIDSCFKNGFKKTIEKAREIANELKT